MQPISLKSIKWENVRAILASLSAADVRSRAEIAAETGLSLMTVGKVADALLALGVVRQTKQTKSAAGRRAGILTLNEENYALILDMSTDTFTLSAVDCKLAQMFESAFPRSDHFTYAEHVSLFLREAAAYIASNAEGMHCIGVGVSLPSEEDAPLFSLPLDKMLKSAFPTLPLCAESDTAASAASNVYGLKEEESHGLLFYCFASDGKIRGALMKDGNVVAGTHTSAGNYGKTLLSRGRTLASAVRADNPPEENADEIAKLLYNVMVSVAPDTVILESEFLSGADAFTDMVQNALIERYGCTHAALPRFARTACPFRHAHRGLAIRLREEWLYRMMISDGTEK